MGSLLEITAGGRDPITLPDGRTRAYLADGDTVTLSGSAPGPDSSRIEFGTASGQVISQTGG
jgi:fumarylacetoacetase